MYNRAGPTVSVQQYQLQRKYSIRDDQIDQKALPTSSNLAIHRIQHQQSLPPLPTQPATTNAQIRLAPNVLNSTNNKRWQTLKRSTAIITTLPQSASVDTPLWPDNQQQYQSGKNKRLLTRSNSQEVIEEEPSKPTPHLRDVIFSLRRYSDSWFKEVSVKHPEIFVDSANYANFARTQHNLKPLVGFQASQTVFLDDQRLITCVGRFLCQIDLTDCRDERTIVDMNSKIMSLEVSTKFDILAVCVDFRRGSTVFIKETEDITKTRNSFLVGLLANQICITPNGQFLLLLEIEPDRRTARISIHNLIDGKQYAEAKFDLKIPSKIFEMSLCPADEDVICLLTDDCIRLLRITPGVISTFSTAKVFNFTCHTWCDDVTLAFGTTDGRLALYRETLALETIDLGKMHNSLIADAQQANRASVVRMHSSDQGLLVCVEIGVVFLFPPLDEDDKQARWHNSKAIVIESLSSTLCHRLSIEPSGNHIIYTDQQCIWLCNIQYAESVCRKGMRLITAQHHRPIKQLAVDIIESEVCASLDTSGTVIVTSNTSKKLLATHYEKDLINIAILRDGQKLLLLTPTHLKHYYLLCQRLQFDRNLLENKQFLYMATNFSMELLALLSSDTLYILHLESFERKCYVSVGEKEQVVSLKWSPDSTKVGILSNQDTLALVDVVNGQLLWTLDLKLRFFVDISVVDDTLYAMGNKFMLSRLSDGKEIETNNVHQEGISLKASSTLLLSTKQVHFVSSSGGNVIRMEHETAENAAVVNCPDQSSISTIFYDPKKDQMFVGFEDGKVICFEVMSAENEKRTEDQVVHSNDFVLCPVSDVLKHETELKNLTVQCNLIRGQSERILDEYKEIKERELSDVRGELESTLQAMREKMKRAEERYEAIETSKEEAFARMKQEMVDTVNDQKKYYEKMVNDQIKASIEKEESQTKQLHDIETDFQAKIAQLQETFKREEKKAQRNVTKFNLEKQKLTSDIKLLQSHEKSLVRKHAEEKRQFELRLEQEQKNHDERSQENVYQIKQLKAYLLREREAKETCDATIADLRTELITRNEEIEKLKAEVEQFTVSIEQETAKSTDLSKKLETSKRNHDVLFQKQKLLSSELASEKQLRHAHQRRLKHFEMLVDELSEHIYEPRRLEQNVLGLLAFFNSVPKSGQMQTNEQVNSVEKKKSGVTKRIVQLGNARHKAH